MIAGKCTARAVADREDDAGVWAFWLLLAVVGGCRQGSCYSSRHLAKSAQLAVSSCSDSWSGSRGEGTAAHGGPVFLSRATQHSHSFSRKRFRVKGFEPAVWALSGGLGQQRRMQYSKCLSFGKSIPHTHIYTSLLRPCLLKCRVPTSSSARQQRFVATRTASRSREKHPSFVPSDAAKRLFARLAPQGGSLPEHTCAALHGRRQLSPGQRLQRRPPKTSARTAPFGAGDRAVLTRRAGQQEQ